MPPPTTVPATATSPNAFAYRKSKIENCTCNGKDAYGLVNMKAADDPTLRPGDIVATDSGLGRL